MMDLQCSLGLEVLPTQFLAAAALEGCNGCNCTRRFLGKTLGKTKLHPSIFGKDHRLHPSIENPKAAAAYVLDL